MQRGCLWSSISLGCRRKADFFRFFTIFSFAVCYKMNFYKLKDYKVLSGRCCGNQNDKISGITFLLQKKLLFFYENCLTKIHT